MSKKQKLKTIDLHGYKQDMIFDALDKFIMKNQNQSQVLVMTGKGKGIVQKEAIKYLKLGGYPWKYQTLDSGKENTGCLIVFIG